MYAWQRIYYCALIASIFIGASATLLFKSQLQLMYSMLGCSRQSQQAEMYTEAAGLSGTLKM